MVGDAKLQQSAFTLAWRGCRGAFVHAAVFSAVVNLLMLTGPLFMMQVYDRVLTSHSQETLVALFLLVTFLFCILMGLDGVRGRLLLGAGARLRAGLDDRAFRAGLSGACGSDGSKALRELDALQRALSAPVAVAVMDLPWVPLFLVAIFALHPVLGWFAVAGGLALAALSALQGHLTAAGVRQAAICGANADRQAQDSFAGRAVIAALGMRGAATARWSAAQQAALAPLQTLAARTLAFGSAGRGLRLYLQSALLAVGAWLCLSDGLGGGAMVAASVIFGRALAPVEGVIAGWPLAVRAAQAHRWLKGFEGDRATAKEPVLALPTPRGTLVLRDVALHRAATAGAVVRGVSLATGPGRIVGIAGPSGAGKSTLLAAMAGLVPLTAGDLRLDGARLDQYQPDQLGMALGYLPQEPALLGATVAENIARLAVQPDPGAVIAAADRAGAHKMILTLPQGYDTPLGPMGSGLSGGQARRIALARALFGQPALLLLDEPDAGLDGDTLASLIRVITRHAAGGGAVVLASHRFQMLGICDDLLVLNPAHPPRFGLREKLLSSLMQTHPATAQQRSVA
jgi:ATP-binding cassette subfamily C protein